MPRKIALLFFITLLPACEKVLEYEMAGSYYPVAYYNPLNLVNGQTVAIVLGAPSPTGVGPGGLNSTDLSSPVFPTITYDGTLTISTSFRIAVYPFVPVVNYTPMGLVLGQVDKVTNFVGPGDARFYWGPPGGLHFDGIHVWVADQMGNRIIAYKPPPQTDGPNGSFTIGSNLVGSPSSGCTRSQMSLPTQVKAANGKLFVVDSGNNRVLIYNNIPTSAGALPDLVLGQPDFTTCVPLTNQATMATPTGMWTDGTRILVADTGGSRVLYWDHMPTTNGAPATHVIGQPTFTNSTPSATAAGLSGPRDVISNGTQIFVSDTGNNRVLVYNSFPTASTPNADVVIGQPDMVTTTAGSTPAKLDSPSGVAINDVFLVVTDTDNNRVMIFLTF